MADIKTITYARQNSGILLPGSMVRIKRGLSYNVAPTGVEVVTTGEEGLIFAQEFAKDLVNSGVCVATEFYEDEKQVKVTPPASGKNKENKEDEK